MNNGGDSVTGETCSEIQKCIYCCGYFAIHTAVIHLRKPCMCTVRGITNYGITIDDDTNKKKTDKYKTKKDWKLRNKMPKWNREK